MKIYFLIIISLIVSTSVFSQKKLQYKELAGEYNLPTNKNGSLFGRVDITYLGENEIQFQLEVATASGCTGLLDGKAKINGERVAVYSDANCEQLTFTFGKDKVDIEEKHCTDHHGMICHFARTYYKKSS